MRPARLLHLHAAYRVSVRSVPRAKGSSGVRSASTTAPATATVTPATTTATPTPATATPATATSATATSATATPTTATPATATPSTATPTSPPPPPPPSKHKLLYTEIFPPLFRVLAYSTGAYFALHLLWHALDDHESSTYEARQINTLTNEIRASVDNT
ncbi:hypothetical protein MVES1_002814 [Malassezia vespertilionis]|uniref:Uncharacterized protein n=1 Tax=Malassezia vespertilionis TaxID=2020962 RepID=A0A2N1JAH2_9BASI|nr:uncharacterized protein MVES1_002814 [Malassezia vespertilionis]PKI83537.1 hypothetical protein MVES_002659 [Malassezia vespertilionis]WFD07449.1 hypothetical protein MVES1_002814 [Malassezia vespertilionis]